MLTLAVSSSGCSWKECTDEYVFPSYRITVQDQTSGELICDALVTVGGAEARRSQVDCSYAYEIPTQGPSTTIGASKDGYQSVSQEVSTAYEEDDCGHAVERSVKLVLPRQ